MLFPYVEAGLGHIMTMKSIEDSFRKKYGDKVEIISSKFYTETNNPHLIRYEQMLARQVRLYNGHPVIGHFATFCCEFFGTFLSSYNTLCFVFPFAYHAGKKHMQELHPDVIFSTHWATNYYAHHIQKKPFTVMYCPDAQLNKLFEYHSDLNMISMPKGYEKALKKRKYTKDNMKMVPFLIRNEAFSISADKKELRKSLGLPENNFTILLAEGGYGIGKMKAICELLIREHLPLTIIPVCGKNEKLFQYFQSLKPTKEITFLPQHFAKNILELEAASDLFCGKSGNIIAEPTFFGVPSIITNCSTLIEKNIADHYVNTVGCAFKEFSPKKTVDAIKQFANNPTLLKPYQEAAKAYHDQFGSEYAANLLWEAIKRQFPDIES